jgi:predicted transcriptional regulator
MNPNSEVLEEFERKLLSAVAQADDYGVPQADIMRPFLLKIPEATLRYRIRMMERQKRIKTRSIGGRRLILPVEE